jgi:sugar phosphate isomerase/epimerase
MKFSISTYSLSGLVGENGVTEKDLIKIAKEIGFEGIEFAEIHTPENKDKIEDTKELNEECN